MRLLIFKQISQLPKKQNDNRFLNSCVKTATNLFGLIPQEFEHKTSQKYISPLKAFVFVLFRQKLFPIEKNILNLNIAEIEAMYLKSFKPVD